MKIITTLLISFFYVASSYADDYYWKTTTSSSNSSPSFSSAVLACDYLWSNAGQYYANQGYSKLDINFQGPTQATCRFTGGGSYGTVYRFGTSCPQNHTYNSSTGECVTPEPSRCESTIGSRIFRKAYIGVVGPMGTVTNRNDPPGAICISQCQYVFTTTPAQNIYHFPMGEPPGAYGNYEYLGNGVDCIEPDYIEPDVKDVPYSHKTSECSNKIVHSDGSQTYDCRASELNVDPGNMNCSVGEVNGVMTCVPKSPVPKHSEKNVDQQIQERTHPDGSSTTTTTTTTTNTSCVGVNACTTTTTTNVNTSGKNADGSPGQTSNTCTGPGCKNGGDGSNVGDEKGEEEGVERDATVGACGAPIACQGDAIDCAILEKQKEQQCFAEEMSDFDGKKSDIEGLFQGENYQLDEGSTIDAPSFINQGTRFLPASSCPSDETFNLSMAGGHSFSLSFEPLCRAASDLSGLFVVITTVLAALYVGRSVGGN